MQFLASASTRTLLTPTSIRTQISTTATHFSTTAKLMTTTEKLLQALTPKSADKPLFKFQQSLPKLPVPSLNETLPKYLRSVKGLISESDYAKTAEVVENFARSEVAQTLQARLVERSKTEKTSWLYEWWNDYSYMGYRDPVVVFVSYFFVFKDSRVYSTPASRAASLITAALDFKNLVVSQELAPEGTKSGALSMDQYHFLFNNCRVPKIPSDTTKSVDPETNDDIVVIRKNRFYVVKAVQNGKRLSTNDFQRQLEFIYKHADEAGNADPVGVLTTLNRDIWTHARDELVASPINRASLEEIENSSFVVCLDDSRPITREESSRACWHGDGKNRWFDKPLQFIVFDNGKAGFCGEHSMMDATPTSRLCEYVCEVLDKQTVDHGVDVGRVEMPRVLEFDVSNETKKAMETAESSFKKLIGEHELFVQAYFGYGKNLIKKFKCSPDAYVQMAIQLAFYKMYQTTKPTYESATTRKFQFGRTETCRSASVESIEYTKTMESLAPVHEKAQALRKAIDSHVKYMADCVEGKGCDRHLLGLKLSLKEGEAVPELFTDPTFNYSKYWILSTSQITSEYYDGYGWGEVVPEGFGIAYMVKENSIHFNVVARKEVGAEKMRYYLGEALEDMKAVMGASMEGATMKAKL